MELSVLFEDDFGFDFEVGEFVVLFVFFNFPFCRVEFVCYQGQSFVDELGCVDGLDVFLFDASFVV